MSSRSRMGEKLQGTTEVKKKSVAIFIIIIIVLVVLLILGIIITYFVVNARVKNVVGEACTVNTDCESTLTCTGGLCAATGTGDSGDTCATIADCFGALECVSGECKCAVSIEASDITVTQSGSGELSVDYPTMDGTIIIEFDGPTPVLSSGPINMSTTDGPYVQTGLSVGSYEVAVYFYSNICNADNVIVKNTAVGPIM